MSDTWAEIEIRRTRTVIITARCESRCNGKAHNVYMDQPTSFYAICRAHRTAQEITKSQSETIEDSESFCKKCLAGDAPTIKKIHPDTEELRRELARAQGQLPAKSERKKWKVGESFNVFINSLDI